MCRRAMIFSFLGMLSVSSLLPSQGLARMDRWVIGGSGNAWQSWGTYFAAEDSLGGIQPLYFNPDENICTKIQRPLHRDKWYKVYRDWRTWQIRGTDTGWREGFPNHAGGDLWRLVDGDSTTFNSWYAQNAGPDRVTLFFDFGIPVPVDSILFYTRPHTWFTLGGGRAYSEDRPPRDWMLEACDGQPENIELGTGKPIFHRVTFGRGNNNWIVGLKFPQEWVRFWRWKHSAFSFFELAEIELHGDGFAQESRYESKVIDLNKTVNLGTISWGSSVWRSEAVAEQTEQGMVWRRKFYPAGDDAPVSLIIQTRTGTDPTPMLYQKINEFGELEEVSEKEYRFLPWPVKTPLPGNRGPVVLDREHWSPWSVPYRESGDQIDSPGAKRYFQFRVIFKTESPEYMVRLDSLVFHYSYPILADRVVAEVAVAGRPQEIAKVIPGQVMSFIYEVKAMGKPTQSGFDSLAIDVPSQAAFDSLQVGTGNFLITVARTGDILGKITPWSSRGDSVVAYRDLVSPGDSIFVDTSLPGLIVLYFPSQMIVPGGSRDRLRLNFKTAAFVYGTRFTGRVWKSGTASFAQSIEEGDASEHIGANSLQLLMTEEVLSREVLTLVKVSPRVITPNNDGKNDQLTFSYTLSRLTQDAEVEIGIYDLAGHLVAQLWKGLQGKGSYTRGWAGRAGDNKLVPPGLYVYQIYVKSDEGVCGDTGTIGVVY
ncbi:MAG TPA: hypothetical protein EYP53_06645 [Candidatus Latescibacteria bacterium]|nr:hypothetical protein [Candidatus Latescibacterota bacterium]